MLSDPLIFGSVKIKLDAIGSTNDYARDLLTKQAEIIEGTVVIAENQHGGRGQRGNIWVSEPGKNLILSVVLYPKFLSPPDQFMLSKAISIGIVGYLQNVLPVNMSAVQVKWPNDIYVGANKIGGILIENTVSGSRLVHSVVGIGLNVNQDKFDENLPNPTSMKLISGHSWDTHQILQDLCSYLDSAYIALRNQGAKVNSTYLKNLYRYGELGKYEMDGAVIRARITGVDDSGKLILEKDTGEQVLCGFKDVTFR